MEQRNVVRSRVRWPIGFARVFTFLAFVALVGAWVTEVTGTERLGMNQQHLFSDATALAVLGIACFIDAYWHARGL